MKASGFPGERIYNHLTWSSGEDSSILAGEVKFANSKKTHIRRKRLSGTFTDAEARKRGEQMGLETPVVHALNDECSMSENFGV